MTPYRFDNQEKKTKASRTKIAVAGLCVVAIILIVVFVVAPLAQRVARGPEWLARSVAQGAQDAVSELSPKSVILQQNAVLKARLEQVQAQLVGMQMTEDENAKLQAELSYLPTPALTMTARVLAKPNQSLYNSLVIDQGSAQGVHVGQLVTVQGTIGLGKVSSVSARTATVDLFSGPRFSGDMVMSSQNITVPAVGKGGGNFEIHIPREIKVADGDILAFPDMPNLAVGVVKSVIFDSRDPFQTVLARTPVNIQELTFVELVK